MNWIDIVLLAIITLAALRGLGVGLIRQTLAIIGFVVGLYAAIAYNSRVAAALDSVIGVGALTSVIAFVLILGVAWFVSSATAATLRGALKALGLAWTDNVFGLIAGVLLGLLGASLFVLLLARIPVEFVQNGLAGSSVASWIADLLPQLRPWLPSSVPLFHTTSRFQLLPWRGGTV